MNHFKFLMNYTYNKIEQNHVLIFVYFFIDGQFQLTKIQVEVL